MIFTLEQQQRIQHIQSDRDAAIRFFREFCFARITGVVEVYALHQRHSQVVEVFGPLPTAYLNVEHLYAWDFPESLRVDPEKLSAQRLDFLQQKFPNLTLETYTLEWRITHELLQLCEYKNFYLQVRNNMGEGGTLLPGYDLRIVQHGGFSTGGGGRPDQIGLQVKGAEEAAAVFERLKNIFGQYYQPDMWLPPQVAEESAPYQIIWEQEVKGIHLMVGRWVSHHDETHRLQIGERGPAADYPSLEKARGLAEALAGAFADPRVLAFTS